MRLTSGAQTVGSCRFSCAGRCLMQSHLLHVAMVCCSCSADSCYLQACFLALSQKRRHHQTDQHFEEDCKIKHNLVYPPGNSYPSSLYMMRKLVGCQEVHEVEQHVCVNDCCKFNKLKPSQYRGAVNQKCRVCGERRFDTRLTSRKERLFPRKGAHQLACWGWSFVASKCMWNNCLMFLQHVCGVSSSSSSSTGTLL